MNGYAIGAQALGHAGLRDLPTEYGGPRPGGVRTGETLHAAHGGRIVRATRP